MASEEINAEYERVEAATSAQTLKTAGPSSGETISRRVSPQRHMSDSFGTGDDNVRMMEGWSGSLPDGVMSTILALLPLVSLLRFRTVSKKGNSLFEDRLFQETRAQVDGGQLYLQSCLQYIQLLEKSPAFAGSEVVSSVGGLLLLVTANESDEAEDLHVIDPSKASIRKISLLPDQRTVQYIGCGMLKNQKFPSKSHSVSRYYTVGMVMNPHTRVYNILAATQGHEGSVAMHVYDSSQDAWQSAGSLLHEPGQTSFYIQSVVLHNDALHCLSVGLNFRVLRYEKQQRQWHELEGVFPTGVDNRTSNLLFEHRGRLLFFGISNRTFYIWEYDSEKLEWRVTDFLAGLKWPASKGGMRIFSHACGDHFFVGWDVFSCIIQVTKSGEHVRKIAGTADKIYNIGGSSWRLLSEPEDNNRVVSWLGNRFLYESTLLSSRSRNKSVEQSEGSSWPQ